MHSAEVFAAYAATQCDQRNVRQRALCLCSYCRWPSQLGIFSWLPLLNAAASFARHRRRCAGSAADHGCPILLPDCVNSGQVTSLPWGRCVYKRQSAHPFCHSRALIMHDEVAKRAAPNALAAPEPPSLSNEPATSRMNLLSRLVLDWRRDDKEGRRPKCRDGLPSKSAAPPLACFCAPSTLEAAAAAGSRARPTLPRRGAVDATQSVLAAGVCPNELQLQPHHVLTHTPLLCVRWRTTMSSPTEARQMTKLRHRSRSRSSSTCSTSWRASQGAWTGSLSSPGCWPSLTLPRPRLQVYQLFAGLAYGRGSVAAVGLSLLGGQLYPTPTHRFRSLRD
jgi:hypothetical protein